MLEIDSRIRIHIGHAHAILFFSSHHINSFGFDLNSFFFFHFLSIFSNESNHATRFAWRSHKSPLLAVRQGAFFFVWFFFSTFSFRSIQHLTERKKKHFYGKLIQNPSRRHRQQCWSINLITYHMYENFMWIKFNFFFLFVDVSFFFFVS